MIEGLQLLCWDPLAKICMLKYFCVGIYVQEASEAMTVLGIAVAATNNAPQVLSNNASPTQSGIGQSSKRATRGKAGSSNVGGSRSPQKKTTQPPPKPAIVKEVREDDSSHHPMIRTRSASKKFLVIFEVEHVLCKILGDERRDLGSLCENYKKVQDSIVALRWSSNQLIKDCMSKFLVAFYSSLPYDMMYRIVDILLRGVSERPLFIWSRVDCVQTKISHPENPETMLVMKDLEKVYKRVKGPMTFTRRNTILVDSNVLETVCIPSGNVVHPKRWGDTDFEKTYLSRKVWGYLLGLDIYDDVLTYTGAHEMDGEPRISPNHMHWKDVASFCYSS